MYGFVCLMINFPFYVLALLIVSNLNHDSLDLNFSYTFKSTVNFNVKAL